MVPAGFSETNYEPDAEHHTASGQLTRETKDSPVRGDRRQWRRAPGWGRHTHRRVSTAAGAGGPSGEQESMIWKQTPVHRVGTALVKSMGS